MIRRTGCLLFALFLSTGLFGQKNRSWEEATVRELGSRTFDGPEAIDAAGGNVVIGQQKSTLFFYLIETATYSYALSNKNRLNLVVGSKTRIAIEKSNAYLIDGKGKEQKLDVVKSLAK